MTKETQELIDSVPELQKISMIEWHAVGDLIDRVKNNADLSGVNQQRELLLINTLKLIEKESDENYAKVVAKNTLQEINNSG